MFRNLVVVALFQTSQDLVESHKDVELMSPFILNLEIIKVLLGHFHL